MGESSVSMGLRSVVFANGAYADEFARVNNSSSRPLEAREAGLGRACGVVVGVVFLLGVLGLLGCLGSVLLNELLLLEDGKLNLVGFIAGVVVGVVGLVLLCRTKAKQWLKGPPLAERAE